MTFPPGPGGRGANPFDLPAGNVIGTARAAMDPRAQYRPPPSLTKEEKAEARDKALICTFCAAIHPLPSSPACPRIASCELNGDGDVIKAAFWKPGEWEYEYKPSPRVLPATAVAEEEDSDG